jgi:TPP-dependent trihydroxycyclohexane-1,2-dione (THcHDO) dehydratase
MPVILAAQEAEVQSQSRLIVHKTLSQKSSTQTRHWWLTPVIPATQEAEIRRIEV